MGQFVNEIPDHLIEWLPKQHMFWVASAPLSPEGHINISPKGIEGTFHVENSRKVWYEDLSGTGAETVAHIRENGRITIMFHAFEGPARIVRLYGKGFVYELGTPEYENLLSPEERLPGSRAIIGLDVTKVGTTCGYAVPYYQFLGHRTQLMDWAANKEAIDHVDAMHVQPLDAALATSRASGAGQNSIINSKGMRHWWQLHNLKSIDGLPSFSLDFGKNFPFVFSFGRIRAPVISPKKNMARERQVAAPLHTQVLSDPYYKSRLMLLPKAMSVDMVVDQLPQAFKLLAFFVVFLLGVVIGRGYDRYYHHLSGLVAGIGITP